MELVVRRILTRERNKLLVLRCGLYFARNRYVFLNSRQEQVVIVGSAAVEQKSCVKSFWVQFQELQAVKWQMKVVSTVSVLIEPSCAPSRSRCHVLSSYQLGMLCTPTRSGQWIGLQTKVGGRGLAPTTVGSYQKSVRSWGLKKKIYKALQQILHKDYKIHVRLGARESNFLFCLIVGRLLLPLVRTDEVRFKVKF